MVAQGLSCYRQQRCWVPRRGKDGPVVFYSRPCDTATAVASCRPDDATAVRRVHSLTATIIITDLVRVHTTPFPSATSDMKPTSTRRCGGSGSTGSPPCTTVWRGYLGDGRCERNRLQGIRRRENSTRHTPYALLHHPPTPNLTITTHHG